MAPGENKVETLGPTIPCDSGYSGGAGNCRALWTLGSNSSLCDLLQRIRTCQDGTFATCHGLWAQEGCCVPGCPWFPVPGLCLELCTLSAALCSRHHFCPGHDHEWGA